MLGSIASNTSDQVGVDERIAIERDWFVSLERNLTLLFVATIREAIDDLILIYNLAKLYLPVIDLAKDLF